MKYFKIFFWGLTPCLFFVNCKFHSNSKTDALRLYSVVSSSSDINKLSMDEKRLGWKLLFNGNDFNGWHGYNIDSIPDSWFIIDGCLTTKHGTMQESKGIVTNKEYEKFALYAEFRMTTSANSGILYQVNENDIYTFPYETGPEFQIIDHDNWPEPLEDVQICGANYGMYAPLMKSFRKIGEWNKAFILVNGHEVTYILNDAVVVNYLKYSPEWNELRDDGKWKEFPDFGNFDVGHIALQNHGTKVFFRNVKIKEF